MKRTINFITNVIMAGLLSLAIIMLFALTVNAQEPNSVPISRNSYPFEKPEITNKILNSETDGIYPETFMVTQIESQTENGIEIAILYLACANGNTFTYILEDGQEDWLVGDMAAAIMGDNSTCSVYDDYIIALEYSGYPGVEPWAIVPYRPY